MFRIFANNKTQCLIFKTLTPSWINTYLPSGNSAQNTQYRSSCLQDIYLFLTKDNKDQIILCGDSNTVLHQIDKANSLLPRHDHHKLTDMLDVHSFVDAYRSLHPFTVSHSYSRKNTPSRIDRFYISRSIEQEIQQIWYMPLPQVSHLKFHGAGTIPRHCWHQLQNS